MTEIVNMVVVDMGRLIVMAVVVMAAVVVVEDHLDLVPLRQAVVLVATGIEKETEKETEIDLLLHTILTAVLAVVQHHLLGMAEIEIGKETENVGKEMIEREMGLVENEVDGTMVLLLVLLRIIKVLVLQDGALPLQEWCLLLMILALLQSNLEV